jgi:hypothetical protein
VELNVFFFPVVLFDSVLITQFLAIATAALKLLRSPAGALTPFSRQV